MDTLLVIGGWVLFYGGPILATVYAATWLSRSQAKTKAWIKYVTLMLIAVVTTAVAIFLFALRSDGREVFADGYWIGGQKSNVMGAMSVWLSFIFLIMLPSIRIMVRSNGRVKMLKRIENNPKYSGE